MAEREDQDLPQDLGTLVVPPAGALTGTGDPWEPYRLTGPDGGRVEAVAEFSVGTGGGRAAGDNSAVIRHGAAALVPVPFGGWGPVGSGDQDRGPRLLPVDPAR